MQGVHKKYIFIQNFTKNTLNIKLAKSYPTYFCQLESNEHICQQPLKLKGHNWCLTLKILGFASKIENSTAIFRFPGTKFGVSDFEFTGKLAIFGMTRQQWYRQSDYGSNQSMTQIRILSDSLSDTLVQMFERNIFSVYNNLLQYINCI